MRPRIDIISLFIIIFIFLRMGAVNAQVLRVAQFEAPPGLASNLPGGGTTVQLAREAFALQGIKITIKWYPLKRALQVVRAGKADMSLSLQKTPERMQQFLFNDIPLATMPVNIFYIKDTPFHWTELGDLKGLVIGDRLGNLSGGKDFLAAEHSGILTVDRVPTDVQNLKKLLRGRIDILIGIPFGMTAELKKHFTPEEQNAVVKHPRPLNKIVLFSIFNKQTPPEIIQAFDAGLGQLKKNGRYDALYNEAVRMIQ